MSQSPEPWHDLSGEGGRADAEAAKLRRWKPPAAEARRAGRRVDPIWALAGAAVVAVGAAVCFAILK